VIGDEADRVETPCGVEGPGEVVEAGRTTMVELDNEGLITMLGRLERVLLVVPP
jgi:hypothetical protein